MKVLLLAIATVASFVSAAPTQKSQNCISTTLKLTHHGGSGLLSAEWIVRDGYRGKIDKQIRYENQKYCSPDWHFCVTITGTNSQGYYTPNLQYQSRWRSYTNPSKASTSFWTGDVVTEFWDCV
ncbi:hypothetical protein BGZ94_001892 [Podila epigama]|nr:hypothetical protein BGZ94_001892 [Podila epigama]